MTEICKCGHDETPHYENGCYACDSFDNTCKKFVPQEKTYNESSHDVLEGELTKRAETKKGCGKGAMDEIIFHINRIKKWPHLKQISHITIDKEFYYKYLETPFIQKPTKIMGIDFVLKRDLDCDWKLNSNRYWWHHKVCGEYDYLCPKCKPQNHSPEDSKNLPKTFSSGTNSQQFIVKNGHEIEKHLSGPMNFAQPKTGTNSQQKSVNRLNESSGEYADTFNLSEKIRREMVKPDTLSMKIRGKYVSPSNRSAYETLIAKEHNEIIKSIEQDIKEFIQRLKELLHEESVFASSGHEMDIMDEINKLAGKELVE